MNHPKMNILLESNHHYLMAIHHDKKMGESVENFDDSVVPSSGAENIQWLEILKSTVRVSLISTHNYRTV